MWGSPYSQMRASVIRTLAILCALAPASVVYGQCTNYTITVGGGFYDYEIDWELVNDLGVVCLLYTSDAADERSSVDLGGRRIINKKKRARAYARDIALKYKKKKM